jgi:hypothetical protein
VPLTLREYEKSMHQPALCELLPVRDFLDDVLVRTSGALVAGYELGGINSYYHGDETRNRIKGSLEALARALPERSMRMQVRFEVVEGLGDLRQRYNREQRSGSPVLQELDRMRFDAWAAKDSAGYYLRPLLHVYFCWDPRIHHEATQSGTTIGRKLLRHLSPSVDKCIQRTRREHDDLLSEFNSLLSGVEQTLAATGMDVHRMSDDEMFGELKRAMNPLLDDGGRLRRPEDSLSYRSAREQAVNTNIEDEQETYLKIGGLLYSFISLKELPDGTFPGLLRELISLDFPLMVCTEVMVPDQAKVIAYYKGRLRRMMSAQKDTRGAFRVNIEAQVAEGQLMRVLQDVISSSLKTCRVSVIIGVRTSRPVESRGDLEEAQRVLADRRQRALHVVMRMNGARGLQEDLAKRRLYIGSLPGLAEENKREHDCLTLHAADLLPAEMPWQGTPQSPLILLETPYRQLVPFSPFDPSLSDANLLLMGKSGGGKTFMAQKMLVELGRANPQISILERGDSYRPLVELMGGRVIEVDLDSNEALNPWDLPSGERAPNREKIAFLKNLTRHMIGESSGSDSSSLLDNVLTKAISDVYKRASARHPNPIPTFTDLRDELLTYRNEEKIERVNDEAKLAGLKLGAWTGNEGIYARLFDRHTTMRTDANWLFFNVEGLSSDPKLETAMSMVIANAMSSRASGRTGQPSITVLDECWFLLESPVLAPEVVQLFRTARKRYSSVWGISQTLEDFVGTDYQPKLHGPGIIKNSSIKIVGPQPGDVSPLVNHLFLNEVAIGEIKRFSSPRKGRSAEALLVIGEKAETTQTIRIVPTPVEYWVCTTFPRERAYRKWWLKKNGGRPLMEAYKELATRFPQGLAEAAALPEEASGAVNAAWEGK